MSLIDEIIKKLIDLKVAKPDEISGCSAEEIAEIQRHQNVDFLPELYREFLAKMGKGAGEYLLSFDYFYSNLLHLKEEVKNEILQEHRTMFRLPDDAFVYLANQSYEFFYFHTGNKDNDPPIYYYIEGDGSTLDVQPVKKWERLSEYFESELADITRFLG